MRRRRAIAEGVAGLFPGSFALVMATGIVSIACWLRGMETIARALLWFNVGAYAVLWLLTLARLVRYPSRILADVLDHGRAPGFFTTVAATCVLGSQILLLTGATSAPRALWIAGIALWALVTYGFFTVVTIKQDKPPIETGLNGAWLIAVVATQSVAVLGAMLAPHQAPGPAREVALFFCTSIFLVGCLLYLVLITLILYRFTFFRFTSVQLAPPYWINMGAVAITTVAGASLLAAAPLARIPGDVAPFLRGFTLFFWAIATWWIPLLLILGVWRHGLQRVRLRYDPQYWGLVFPLGMYTTATLRLAEVLEVPFLVPIAQVSVYVALAAWGLAFIGLVHYLVSTLVVAPRPPEA
jgi:tellurite resistance protein TehA-like permease